MPKFFCISDIHSFYYEMITALDNAGFDSENENHYLLVSGDCFDRGSYALEVLNYLESLERVIVIKGNHTDLLMKLIKSGIVYGADISNGTFNTVLQISQNAGTFPEACEECYERIKDFVNNMVDYVELKNHIFVHSWIPIKETDCGFEFNENWRNADKSSWDNARWYNPFLLAKKGLLPEKTLVFGHWHCSVGWAEKEGRSEFGEDAKFDTFYGDGYIAIDGCCAHTKKINCLVIEDDFI